MSSDSNTTRTPLYGLLIAAAAGIVAARIAGAELLYEPSLHRDITEPREGKRLWPATRPPEMPTFSSNDRSRWATVRALVDEGTFVVGERDPVRWPDAKRGDHGILFEKGWGTVDKVLDPDTHKFYSTKPPLLPVIAAGEYWLLKNLFGLSIVDERFVVVGVILFTLNWLPFLIYLCLLAKLVDRYGGGEWSRLLVLTAACFGTLLMPFMSTFNNHTPAACCALFALYPALLIWDRRRDAETQRRAQAEKFYADTEREADESTEILERDETDSQAEPVSASPPPLSASAPGWQFALCGFFAGLTASLELPAAAFAAALFLLLAYRDPKRTLLFFVPVGLIPVAAFLITNYMAVGMWTPIYAKFGTEWYEYVGSHWRVEPGETKSGIDFLKEPKPLYAFNLLLGHHGLFSLTPAFLLSLVGLGMWFGRREPATDPPAAPARNLPAEFITLTLFLLVVIVGFYIYKTNNYGGWSSGPRWLMWLTPMLLLVMLPGAEKFSCCRWGRSLAYVIVAFSVFSALYPAANPWRHPWIHVFSSWQGWIDY